MNAPVKRIVKCRNLNCNVTFDVNKQAFCPVCKTSWSVHTPVCTSVAQKNQNYINNQASFVSDSWEVDIPTINDCGKAPKEINVKITPIVKSKIDILMKKYPNIEWLAYLVGEGTTVNDLFIPKQEVSAAAVDNIRCPEFNTINSIGVIHSHHSMGNNFSKTDDDWINQNHDISLCISKSGIQGHVRWKTPCDSYKFVNAKVTVEYNSDFDKEEFIKTCDENIEQGVVTYSYGAYGYQGYSGYNWQREKRRNWSGRVNTGSGVSPKPLIPKDPTPAVNYSQKNLKTNKCNLSDADVIELTDEIIDNVMAEDSK